MNITNERLNKIFDKTRGKCHLCHKQLVFKNHGVHKSRSAWEIEHSKPRSKGGSDHFNNLFPACIKCNREKSDGTNYSVRSKRGVKKAPLSETSKNKKVLSNTLKGALGGAVFGRFFGPVGVVIGGVVGGIVGSEVNPDE